MSNSTVHFKMYKAGKQWLVAGLSLFAVSVTLGATTGVRADVQNDVGSAPTVSIAKNESAVTKAATEQAPAKSVTLVNPTEADIAASKASLDNVKGPVEVNAVAAAEQATIQLKKTDSAVYGAKPSEQVPVQNDAADGVKGIQFQTYISATNKNTGQIEISSNALDKPTDGYSLIVLDNATDINAVAKVKNTTATDITSKAGYQSLIQLSLPLQSAADASKTPRLTSEPTITNPLTNQKITYFEMAADGTKSTTQITADQVKNWNNITMIFVSGILGAGKEITITAPLTVDEKLVDLYQKQPATLMLRGINNGDSSGFDRSYNFFVKQESDSYMTDYNRKANGGDLTAVIAAKDSTGKDILWQLPKEVQDAMPKASSDFITFANPGAHETPSDYFSSGTTIHFDVDKIKATPEWKKLAEMGFDIEATTSTDKNGKKTSSVDYYHSLADEPEDAKTVLTATGESGKVDNQFAYLKLTRATGDAAKSVFRVKDSTVTSGNDWNPQDNFFWGYSADGQPLTIADVFNAKPDTDKADSDADPEDSLELAESKPMIMFNGTVNTMKNGVYPIEFIYDGVSQMANITVTGAPEEPGTGTDGSGDGSKEPGAKPEQPGSKEATKETTKQDAKKDTPASAAKTVEIGANGGAVATATPQKLATSSVKNAAASTVAGQQQVTLPHTGESNTAGIVMIGISGMLASLGLLGTMKRKH